MKRRSLLLFYWALMSGATFAQADIDPAMKANMARDQKFLQNNCKCNIIVGPELFPSDAPKKDFRRTAVHNAVASLLSECNDLAKRAVICGKIKMITASEGPERVSCDKTGNLKIFGKKDERGNPLYEQMWKAIQTCASKSGAGSVAGSGAPAPAVKKPMTSVPAPAAQKPVVAVAPPPPVVKTAPVQVAPAVTDEWDGIYTGGVHQPSAPIPSENFLCPDGSLIKDPVVRSKGMLSFTFGWFERYNDGAPEFKKLQSVKVKVTPDDRPGVEGGSFAETFPLANPLKHDGQTLTKVLVWGDFSISKRGTFDSHVGTIHVGGNGEAGNPVGPACLVDIFAPDYQEANMVYRGSGGSATDAPKEKFCNRRKSGVICGTDRDCCSQHCIPDPKGNVSKICL